MNLEQKLQSVLTSATGRGAVPGVLAAVATDAGVVFEGAAGVRTLGQPAAMTTDTVSWFASMTKAVTGACAMQLVERGKLSLDEPAARVCPELGGVQVFEGFDEAGQAKLRPAKGTVTLRNLLTHTSGFSYEIWNGDVARELEQRGVGNVLSGTRATLNRPLVRDPGLSWDYSPGIDWAGRLVEEASGQTLGEFMRENLFEPLHMRDTGFQVSAEQRTRLAGVHARLPEGTLVPYPFQLPADPEMEMGGHGLYGTIGDYLRFLRMILGGGALDGTRVLEARTVAEMSRNHIGALTVGALPAAPPYSNATEFWPGIPCQWGLSFLINTQATPQGRSAGSLSWAGLANSYYWVDPTRRVAGVMATQIFPFFDGPAVQLFNDMETATYAALN